MSKGRLSAVLIALLVALWFPVRSTAAPAESRRIVAVGDLHGDLKAWLDIARDAHLIDATNHWAGGRTILVQLGDVTDRGPDSLKIIDHLTQLQAEAARAGGRVVVVLGNHEAMNVLGDFRYTSAGDYAAFATPQSATVRDAYFTTNRRAVTAEVLAADKSLSPEQVKAAWIARTPLGWVEHRQAWLPNGPLGQWARRNPAIVRIGDTLFVHGGISAEYSALSIDMINRRVAAALAIGGRDKGDILEDPLGPLWYRGLVTRDPDADAARASTPASDRPVPGDEIAKVLRAYGARMMVVGHTPSRQGILITDGGKLVRTDTGISSFYGGPLGWLEIVGGKPIPHTAKRS